MPSLTDYKDSRPLKILMVGESGTGKTGALASLAEAGYNLRIMDLDNLLGVLADLLRSKPEALARISYVTLTEPMKMVGPRAVPKQATVWTRAVGLMEKWKDGEQDFGPVRDWTTKEVLVIDTLSRLSTGAFNNILALNAKLLTGVTGYEYQRVLMQAQELLRLFMQMLNEESIKCNIIVNAHLKYQDEPGVQRGSQEEVLPQVGQPLALGRALGPEIPSFFGSVLMTKRVNGKPRILTVPTNNVNLKAYAPTRVKAEYAIEDGLAKYFADVKGESK